MEGGLIVTLFLAFIVVIILLKTAVVVPQQSAYVVERLGKFNSHSRWRLLHQPPYSIPSQQPLLPLSLQQQT